MATQTSNSDSSVTLADDERWQLVLRIAASQQFAKATQLREILLYITRRWLLDETVSIHEQDIACTVLGRRESFNPAEDNIVRVQVRHLRKKLELYFETEGQFETVELNVPKGSYIPKFEKRAGKVREGASLVPVPVDPGSDTAASQESSEAKPKENENSQWMSKTWLLVAAVILALVFLYIGRWSRSLDPARAAIRHTGKNFLMDKIFVSDLPVSVVVADTNLVILQNSVHTDITINDYIGKNYPANVLNHSSSPEERKVLELISSRKFTSLADVNVAVRCTELSREFGSKAVIRYARNMNARDFERGNFILIGSRTADPWVALFEPQLNYIYEEDPVSHVFHFRNKHPVPGEPNSYVAHTEPDGSTVSYVDIALIPNLSKNGYVLLLNAATMDANEAAIELVFRDELPPELSKLIPKNVKEPAENQSVEIFLRDHAIDGVVSSFDLVAVKKLG